MKTNKLLLAGVMACLLGTTSCTELIDESYGSVVSENYQPKSELEISALVNAAYIPWRKTMLLWNGVVRTQELSADQDVIPARIGIGWIDGYVYKRWHQHTWTTNDDSMWQPWSRTYEGINTTNRIITQIEEGSITLPTEEQKTALLAELHVLRASYYYILIDLFGNVPLVTDFRDTTPPNTATRAEVFDFIIKDINDNMESLSDESRGYYYGRMNKWVAHTLLAKMYLNAEVWRGQAMWQKCIDECDIVMGSGNYVLEPNQKNIFITENQNSKEIIFALPMDEKYVTDWNAFDFHMQTLAQESQETYSMVFAPWGGVCAIPQFIESFNPADKRLQQNYIQGPQFARNGDPLTINYTNSVPSIDESDKDDGYRWGKFEIKIGAQNRLGNDFPVLRYADVLLMKAEALMRSGQAGAGALVTQVRMRAFDDASLATVTDAQLSAGSTYDYGRRDTNSETHEGGADIQYGRFLDELGWEFCQEGRRRQDLIRFNVFTTKSWFSHDPSNANKNLYPIPLQATQTNSNLVQNPGYGG
ncbi:RagB/SusD family nutrient uptake outer membrane protein [Flavobacterium psychrotrophum]|uniref:RagB/SusD family nutrient uptake outer membrane protein n=1 Tax=Flavobacterium psychrotrophum TaxID=2294119 RepID=UPI000E30ECAD|nr:RagB/SusD family nutrient uptake outer membrane protein [Flavobacterium psychrotrophum]